MSKVSRDYLDSVIEEISKDESRHSSESGIVGTVSVDNMSQADMVSLLTNIYSNPLEASVRETLSNAWDAQVRAGNYTDAISVTFSESAGEYVFSVRDYGCGMTLQELQDNFFSYNNSDKNMLFNERGGFGLGAKSPLALAGKMEVITFKSGVKVKAVAVLNSSENEVVFTEEKSIEKDGTLVSFNLTFDEANTIYNLFSLKEHTSRKSNFTQMLFTFWEDIPLTFNGSHLDMTRYNTIEKALSDSYPNVNVYGEKGERVWTDYAIPYELKAKPNANVVLNVGGVAYCLEPNDKIHDELIKVNMDKNVVLSIEAPTSAVIKFTPSRDGIIYDEITVNNICALIQERATVVRESLRLQLNRLTDPVDVLGFIDFHLPVLSSSRASMLIRTELIPMMVRGKDISETNFRNPYACLSISSSWNGKHKNSGIVKSESNIKLDYTNLFSNLNVLVRVNKLSEVLNDSDIFKQLSLAMRTYRKYVTPIERLDNENTNNKKGFVKNAQNTNTISFMKKKNQVRFFFTEEPLDQSSNSIYLSSFEANEFIEKMKEVRKSLKEAQAAIKQQRNSIKDILVLNIVDDEIFGQMKSAEDVSSNAIILNERFIDYDKCYEQFVSGDFRGYYSSRVDDLKQLALLYPGSDFIILEKNRSHSPLMKRVPEAKPLLSKLLETIELEEVDKLEEMFIREVWSVEFRKLGLWSEEGSLTNNFIRDYTTEPQKLIAFNLLMSMKHISSRIVNDHLTDSQINMTYESKHLKLSKDSQRVSISGLVDFITKYQNSSDYMKMKIVIDESSVYSFISIISLSGIIAGDGESWKDAIKKRNVVSLVDTVLSSKVDS